MSKQPTQQVSGESYSLETDTSGTQSHEGQNSGKKQPPQLEEEKTTEDSSADQRFRSEKQKRSTLESKTLSLNEMITSSPVGSITVAGHPYPRARAARTILFVSAVVKFAGFVALLVLSILMKSGQITVVSKWIDNMVGFVETAQNITHQDPDYHLANNIKTKVHLIIDIIIDVGIVVSGVGIVAQLIGAVGIICFKKPLLSIFLLLDIVLLVILLAVMAGAAIFTRSANHYPSAGNVGLLNYVAGAFFLGTKLYTHHSHNSTDIINVLGILETNYSCCGLFGAEDWWKMKLKFEAVKIFGEGEVTKSKELDIPPEWLLACYMVNGAYRKPKEAYFCYVPAACCKKAVFETENSQAKRQDKFTVTCGDSNISAPHNIDIHKPLETFETFLKAVRNIKKMKIRAGPRYGDKINKRGCIKAILLDLGQLLMKIAIVSGSMAFVFLVVVALTIGVCCK